MKLYHRKQQNFFGDTLYPLNTLKKIYPDIFHIQVKKYNNRQPLLSKHINIFDCLWNDVIHLTAIPPATFNKTLRTLGILGEDKPDFEFFEIDTADLNKHNLCVYFNDGVHESKYILFDEKEHKKYNFFPKETLEYFKKKIDQGEKPLLFNYVPHFLYKGNIDIDANIE